MTRHQLVDRSPAKTGHQVRTACGATYAVKPSDPQPPDVTAWHSDVDCPDCRARSRT